MNKVIFGLLVILTTALMGSSFAIGKIGLAYTSPMLLAYHKIYPCRFDHGHNC